MTKTAIHTTRDGWTFAASQTAACVTARQIKLNGSAEKVAQMHGVPVDTIQRRLRDHRIPRPPNVPAEVIAIMATPLPIPDAPCHGNDDDARLISQCDHAIRVIRDYQAIDAAIEGTRYCPPAAYLARRQRLGEVAHKAHLAAASMPARGVGGIRAKARLIAAYMNPEWDSLDGQPAVESLLADCAALAA